MPGLVDTHTHAPQYFFAGSNVDLPLLEWLTKYAYPVEYRFQNIDFAEEVYTRVVVSILLVSIGILCSVICRSIVSCGQILNIKYRQLRLGWTVEISLVLSLPSEFGTTSLTQLVTSKERI